MTRAADDDWQLSSSMVMPRIAYGVAIITAMRREGLEPGKLSDCHKTVRMVHRLQQRACALHDWLSVIGNPANGPLASGNPDSLDDAAIWAMSRYRAKD